MYTAAYAFYERNCLKKCLFFLKHQTLQPQLQETVTNHLTKQWLANVGVLALNYATGLLVSLIFLTIPPSPGTAGYALGLRALPS